MTQTKSAAHTPECRKILDPSNCSCHVGAYLDQHPHICTNHALAWHHKERITCEEFDAGLDEATGFQCMTEDEAALESRRFKIGRDAEVRSQAARARRAESRANLWQKIATIQAGAYTVTLGAVTGRLLGWW